MTETDECARIYVVDDDLSARESLCALLWAHGHDAVPFACAEDSSRASNRGALSALSLTCGCPA